MSDVLRALTDIIDAFEHAHLVRAVDENKKGGQKLMTAIYDAMNTVAAAEHSGPDATLHADAVAALSAHVAAFCGRDGDWLGKRAERITCADGFMVSVQASELHYARPRRDTPPWSAFECGYPSEPVPEWLEWRDGDVEDTGNVFGFVPALVIWKTLLAHGGPVNLAGQNDKEVGA